LGFYKIQNETAARCRAAVLFTLRDSALPHLIGAIMP
jgi:hypothetical protein